MEGNDSVGIFCSGDQILLENNLIAHNFAEGFYSFDCNFLELRNNTVAHNATPDHVAGVLFSRTEALIHNSVFWRNQSPQILTLGASNLTIDDSLIEGGTSGIVIGSGGVANVGTRILAEDPRFVGSSDFHLDRVSPCINQANPAYSPSLDLEQYPRPEMGTSDLGAYEFHQSHPLQAPFFEISAAAGGDLSMILDAQSSQANRSYVMLASVSGSSPGISLPGGLAVLPIQFDLLTLLSIDQLANSAVFDGFVGVTDGSGRATARFNTLGPLPPESIGLTLTFAYALPSPWDYSSNPVNILITP